MRDLEYRKNTLDPRTQERINQLRLYDPDLGRRAGQEQYHPLEREYEPPRYAVSPPQDA